MSLEPKSQFNERDAQVLGTSVDTHFVHLAWRNNHRDLKDLLFPMLADTKRELSTTLGILHEDGISLRATFIVDPEGCRPTSSARATGRKATPRSDPSGIVRFGVARVPRTAASPCHSDRSTKEDYERTRSHSC